MYLGFHVKNTDFLLDFNQIWNFSTDFHKSPQYKISRKSVQWRTRPDTCRQTNGREKANLNSMRFEILTATRDKFTVL
jgi:hypothetical protein